MKKTLKILNVLLIVAMIVMTATTVVFADDGSDAGKKSSGVNPTTYTGTDSTNLTSGINKWGNSLVTVISTVGSIAAVIVLVVLGLKYMMGSAEEKAEYKKTLIPYVIGAVLVFAASTIAGVIFNFAGAF